MLPVTNPVTPSRSRGETSIPETPEAFHPSPRGHSHGPFRPTVKPWRRLSPLRITFSKPPSARGASDDSMPEAPSPGPLGLEDLFHSSSPKARVKRSVLGDGGNPGEAAEELHAQMDEVFQLVNVDAFPDDAVPSSMGAGSPHLPLRLASHISPVTKSQDYHLVTVDFEPFERHPWQTPPLKRIVRGHDFLDSDESPQQHRMNFPHLYDGKGKSLQPEVPWSGQGYDIGFGPFADRKSVV